MRSGRVVVLGERDDGLLTALRGHLRVHVDDGDVVPVLHFLADLGFGRVDVDEEQQLVLEVHLVHRLLSDDRMLDDGVHRSATSSMALSVHSVSRPGARPARGLLR